MADFPLLLEAPDKPWAEHVGTLVQQALESRGSVHLNLPGESLTGAPGGYTITGIAVCDEPAGDMLALITTKLIEYEVRLEPLDSGVTQIIVAPPEP